MECGLVGAVGLLGCGPRSPAVVPTMAVVMLRIIINNKVDKLLTIAHTKTDPGLCSLSYISVTVFYDHRPVLVVQAVDF